MLPDLGEQLFPTPLAPKNVPDDNERKKPFVNRYCCNGPLGPCERMRLTQRNFTRRWSFSFIMTFYRVCTVQFFSLDFI